MMPLEEFLQQLQQLVDSASDAFAKATDENELEEVRVEYLGAKKGKLKSIQKSLGSIEKSDKPAAGQKLNEVKGAIQTAFDDAKQRLSAGESQRQIDPQFDATLPGHRVHIGRFAPNHSNDQRIERYYGPARIYSGRWTGN